MQLHLMNHNAANIVSFALVFLCRPHLLINCCGVLKVSHALLNCSKMDRSESPEREWYLEAVKNGLHLGTVPKCYRADREIVLAAVQQEGLALRYAAEECKADSAIVLAAVQHNWRALQYAAEECKADREIVLAAVQEDGVALEHAAEGCKADRQI
eukprot:23736-Amphidinium_carterae.1